MKFFVGLIFCLFTTLAVANTAINEINQLLNQRQHRIEQVRSTFNDYYFIYVFKSTCPHCQKFTPLLLDLAKNLAIRLKPYSIDGASISSLSSRQISPELFEMLFTGAGFKPVVPALFLANKVTSEVYPVSFGETDALDLASRLNELLTTIKGRFDV